MSCFGTEAAFPANYQKALYAFDWSFGIIYAVHLTPEGASYSANAEEFISGSPLPLTDGTIGPDGAMYFATGGRRLESDLYRVYYTGNPDDVSALTVEKLPAEAKLRRELESFHERNPGPEGLELAWQNLDHEDRFVQYAARIALEHQPLESWRDKVPSEKKSSQENPSQFGLGSSGIWRGCD